MITGKLHYGFCKGFDSFAFPYFLLPQIPLSPSNQTNVEMDKTKRIRK